MNGTDQNDTQATAKSKSERKNRVLKINTINSGIQCFVSDFGIREKRATNSVATEFSITPLCTKLEDKPVTLGLFHLASHTQYLFRSAFCLFHAFRHFYLWKKKLRYLKWKGHFVSSVLFLAVFSVFFLCVHLSANERRIESERGRERKKKSFTFFSVDFETNLCYIVLLFIQSFSLIQHSSIHQERNIYSIFQKI